MTMLKHLKLAAVLLAAVALLGLGANFALGSTIGTTDGSASTVQYQLKPGCGPDKTEGLAGESGTHEGQPPKEPERKECPEPPGQQ